MADWTGISCEITCNRVKAGATPLIPGVKELHLLDYWSLKDNRVSLENETG